jgi:hypothetical protein
MSVSVAVAVPPLSLPARNGTRCPEPLEIDRIGSIRAVVVQRDERIPDALARMRDLHANTLVTHSPPDPATGRAAEEAAVRYVAWMTTAEIESLSRDPGALARLASVPGLTGVYYEDDAAVEGYTSAEEQRRAYAALRSASARLLVLHPLRLDPIAWDPGYLDRVFRPEYTDAIVPYFYPVGSTVLGAFQESDAWRRVLCSLLVEVERRAPGKPVLPVLQGFEQIGYPVDSELLAAQEAVYRSVWPDVSSASVFEWGLSAQDGPLVGLGFRTALVDGTRELFRELRARRLESRPCFPRDNSPGRPGGPSASP